MSWTDAHAAVVVAFAAKYPCPGGEGESEAARDWTRKLAEQFAFSFPNEGWGHKSAGGGRPPSTDVIATHAPFIGYDVIGGQGRAGWTLNIHPGSEVLTGQEFIAVTPTDWLGTGSGAGPTKPPVTPPAAGLTAEEARLVRAELLELRLAVSFLTGQLREALPVIGKIHELAVQQENRREELAMHATNALIARTTTWPAELSGRMFGAKVTLTGRVGGNQE